MNSRLFSIALLISFLIILGSCKDDDENNKDKDEGPTPEFVFAGTTVSLKDANMYRINNSNCCNNHNIRAYAITDGVYTAEPGWGWEDEDYTGETYYLIVTLLEPDGAEHGSGEYPMYPWWGNEEYLHKRMSYVDLFTTDGENKMEYLTGDDRDKSPVVVKGGLNIGEEMTISFDGILTYRINGEYQTYEEAKFNFTGTVKEAK